MSDEKSLKRSRNEMEEINNDTETVATKEPQIDFLDTFKFSPQTKKRRIDLQPTKNKQHNKKKSLLTAMKKYELDLNETSAYKCIVGVDEAGRGPLAGPVVVAACYVPIEVTIFGIADSKALTEAEREICFKQLTTNSNVKYAVSIVNHKTIDELNILAATLKGMRDSVSKLQRILNNIETQKKDLTIEDDIYSKILENDPKTDSKIKALDEKEEAKSKTSNIETIQNAEKNTCKQKTAYKTKKSAKNSDKVVKKNGGTKTTTRPTTTQIDMILVDGNQDPKFCDPILKNANCECMIKGDEKVYCIAAASIIAKVVRDRLMCEYDKLYPKYQFSVHKGYPTPFHKSMAIKYGPCVIHRVSFNPIKKWCLDNDISRLPKRLIPNTKEEKKREKLEIESAKLAKNGSNTEKIGTTKIKPATKAKHKRIEKKTVQLNQNNEIQPNWKQNLSDANIKHKDYDSIQYSDQEPDFDDLSDFDIEINKIDQKKGK